MKKTLAFLLSLTLILALAACGGGKNNPKSAAAGTYKGVQAKFVGDSEWIPAEGDDAFTLTLTDDGKGTHTRNGGEYKVTWTLDGEKFTMEETFAGLSIQYTGTLKDGDLHLFNGDPENPMSYEYVYKKQ